jgi:DSF synthase
MHHLSQDVDARLNHGNLPNINPTAQTLSVQNNCIEIPPVHPQTSIDNYCQTSFDPHYGVHWVWLKENCPVKFTPGLLKELRQIQDHCATKIENDLTNHSSDRMRYQVIGSKIPGVFSLGGDLALFRDKILTGDANSLRIYARDAIDLVYINAVNYEQPVTTISLLQGQAMGGGFEAAMAANVIVAERQCKLGFPEVMFNMFPGMGAYQLLCRRLSPGEAEQLILSGKTYSAEELYNLGLIDVLAEDGEGEQAVWRYIRNHDRRSNGMNGFRRALQAARPLDRMELYRMVDVWVETALALSERDLGIIEYLLKAQERMQSKFTNHQDLFRTQAY